MEPESGFCTGASGKAHRPGGCGHHQRHRSQGSVREDFHRGCGSGNLCGRKGLKTVNDEGALRATIQEIVAANPKSVEDYHNGKEKALGFLVGQTMKAMKGKANPGMINQILKELL